MQECKQQRRKEELQKTEEPIEGSHIHGQEEYLESMCHEIMEFQRTGHYDLM